MLRSYLGLRKNSLYIQAKKLAKTLIRITCALGLKQGKAKAEIKTEIIKSCATTSYVYCVVHIKGIACYSNFFFFKLGTYTGALKKFKGLRGESTKATFAVTIVN